MLLLLLVALVGCSAGPESATAVHGSQTYPPADGHTPEAAPRPPTQSPTATPAAPLPPTQSPTATPTVSLPPSQDSTATSQVLKPVPGVPADAAFRLTVLHTNDTSGYVDPCG